MLDLVIREGTIVDGTGAPPYMGSVGVSNGVIVEIGANVSRGRHEIDAAGQIITPGFVDIHSHYDGQATWDSALVPSFFHGVTTVIAGNCGVGFAPIRPGDAARTDLIELMEGVEDIPGTALWEGIKWGWETFPEYLDSLAKRDFAMDIGVFVPHGPVRLYVMGRRAADHEPATENDIATMSEIVAEGVRAGGFGFSTSRILGHQSVHGSPVPGTFAARDEVLAIGRATAAAGGLLQLAPGGSTGTGFVKLELDTKFDDLNEQDFFTHEMQWMSELSRETGITATFLVAEHISDPAAWRRALEQTEIENRRGAKLRPQVAGRPQGFMIGWEGRHPFERRPTYMAIANVPFDERIKLLNTPAVRRAILAEESLSSDSKYVMDQVSLSLESSLAHMFPVGFPVNYEPTPDMSVAAEAARLGVSAESLSYDLMLKDDGHGLLMLPSMNYALGNEDALFAMLQHPDTVLGLADGGAHCSITCDGSVPTHMLSHWVRDRKRGPRLTIEAAVRKQTSDTAALIGLEDRGAIAIGKRADLNVIDFDRLALLPPRMVRDLPAGGIRLLQGAQGYSATVVAGVVVRRNDQDTGDRPGRLLRRV